ncbi:MAG: hypothetical protein HS111_08675 [Kofleriaceae bacterium]|nr:hypothetical protein [Kofleriaceae bacterium]
MDGAVVTDGEGHDDAVDGALLDEPRGHRVLVRADDDVVLKAALLTGGWPPHRRALPTLLEALALWHQVPVRCHLCRRPGLVVEAWPRRGSDGGAVTVHYAVEVRAPGRSRGQRISGLGSFVDVRQLDLRGVR